MNLDSAGPINLVELKNSYQNEFTKRLDTFSSPKALYWERRLVDPVSTIVSHSLLKEHDVSKSFFIEFNENACSPPECKSVVFILSSSLQIVDYIHSFIQRDSRINKKYSKEYHIIAVPSFSYACKSLLEEKGVSKSISSICEFPLTLLPLDHDVLSMEAPECFANFTLSQQQQIIYQFVQGLLRFQSIFGLFPKIRAKGYKAVEVARMLIRMRLEAEATVGGKPGATLLNEVVSQTELLVVIDRSVDCLTPLLSQLTYEGLISDKWGIRYGICRFPVDSHASGHQPIRTVLNGRDELFAELRDQNFTAVGPILSKRSKEISALRAESKSAKEITELRRVVDQLMEIRSTPVELETHTAIAEKIHKHVNTDEFMQGLATQQDFLSGIEADKAHPYIEDCILRVAPLEEVLRLICVQSFCNGGLKQRLLEYYKREILQVYGFEHVFTLDNLERIGLLYDACMTSGGAVPRRLLATSSCTNKPEISTAKQTITTVSGMFSGTLKRGLRLLVSPSSSLDQSDSDQSVANAYSGYVPLSTRVIQILSLDWIPKAVIGNPEQPFGSVSAAASALLGGIGLIPSPLPEENVNPSQTKMRIFPNHQTFSNMSAAGGSPRAPNSQQSDALKFVMNAMPGAFLEESQARHSAGYYDIALNTCTKRADSRSKARVIAVAFVGGVTHAEISTLRSLAASSDDNIEFIFITTGFLSAHTFLASMAQCVQPAQLLPF
ncbi:unnamed protein product [Dicrocoelium dendriticum]|nr:unnamed protein product [Dicrocoelium dendriticum]